MPRPSRPDTKIKTAEAAVAVLAKADKKLAKVIEKASPFRLEIPHLQSTFEALAESIVYQQLSGKAAASIFNRLKVLTGETAFPTPEEILALPQSALRGAGLSQAKTLAILDLAARTKAGLIPSADAMQKMSDDELVEILTAVRGIGRWTVDMILIFRLGRLDVMPATDYGVRKGFALTYKLADLPAPKELLAHAERWRPYRTIGSWYMWRANEVFKPIPSPATKTKEKTRSAK
jgi:DNA-3-methyladenine glycosylase II